MLGPGMLGISVPKFLSHFIICRLPEALHILGELDGLESGREQFHQDGSAAVVEAGRLPGSRKVAGASRSTEIRSS